MFTKFERPCSPTGAYIQCSLGRVFVKRRVVQSAMDGEMEVVLFMTSLSLPS